MYSLLLSIYHGCIICLCVCMCCAYKLLQTTCVCSNGRPAPPRVCVMYINAINTKNTIFMLFACSTCISVVLYTFGHLFLEELWKHLSLK